MHGQIEPLCDELRPDHPYAGQIARHCLGEADFCCNAFSPKGLIVNTKGPDMDRSPIIKSERSPHAYRAPAWAIRLAVLLLLGIVPRLALSAGSIFDDDWKAPPPSAKPPAPAYVPPPEPEAPPRLPPARPAPSDTPAPTPDTPAVKPPTPDAPISPALRDRAKVPTDAAIAPAEKLVKDVYKAEYSHATTPAGQIALARALFNEAQQSRDDPVTLYVLLKESRDNASAGGDPQTAVDASRGLRDAFALTPNAAEGMERDALLSATKVVLSTPPTPVAPPESRSAAYLLMAMAERNLNAGNYAQASQAAAQAEQVAKKIGDPSLLDRVHGRATVLSTAAVEYQRIKDSFAALKADSDDPAANLAVGRFYTFVLDRSEQGMPLLAKGSDAALKTLAEREIATTSPSADQLALADAWAAAARVTSGATREGVLRRALHWYDTAGPQLPGLSRVTAQKKALDLRANTLKHGLLGEYFRGEEFGLRVLSRVDSRIEFNWRGLPPDDGVQGEKFSVRWTGWIKGGVAGEYQLIVIHDDAARIWIDGETVLDKWQSGAGKDVQPVHLNGGLQQIKIEYAQYTGVSSMGLGWIPPRAKKAVAISAEMLFHEPIPAGPIAPSPVRPENDGRLNLVAARAELHGSGRYTQEREYPEHIEYWNSAGAPITWDFESPEGDYTVDVVYACDGNNNGAEYLISVGDGRLPGKVADTGGFGTYRTDRLGAVRLTGGPHKLRIKATSKPHESIMGLCQVILTPVK
jgi:hypothetical protein